jgi:MFS family permease
MANPIGDILAPAVGVAISPVPIIAVVLMLFTRKAKSNSLSFLLGWVLGLTIVGGIVLYIAGTQDLSPGSEPSTAASTIKLLLGLLLLFLAAKQWRKRPRPGEEPEMPKWMKTIDSFTPAKAFALALLLSGVNPKNLTLTLAAALSIAQANLDRFYSLVSLGVFVVIGSITIAIPSLIYLIMGNKAAKTLNEMKAWLMHNNATVMFILLLILGVDLVGRSITALWG